MDSFEYMSGVSGGAWFTGVYAYYQSGADNDTQLLGPYVEPADLTTEALEVMPEGCMGAGPQVKRLM